MGRADVLSGLNAWSKPALIAGGVALIGSAAYAVVDATQFFRSYLFAYMYCLAFALGCLPLLALHHMIEGRWGFVIRRLLEAGVRTLPLFAVLFIPILVGMTTLYPWARPEAASDPLLSQKAVYLNVPFFVIRFLIYFAIWIGLGFRLNALSAADDRSPSPARQGQMRRIAAPTILIYAITLTFASIDWVMSLEPAWFSTIFGLIFMIGQALTVFAFSLCVLISISKRGVLAETVQTNDIHDIGTLILAFTTIWAYLSFSQYIIIWSGNLPEEAIWFQSRTGPAWKWMAVILVVFHFIVPFFILLQRRIKRNSSMVTKVAIGILVMRMVDIYWYVVPAFHPETAAMHVLDLLAVVGILGVWFAFYVRQLSRYPLLAVGDWRVQGNPKLREALSHE